MTDKSIPIEKITDFYTEFISVINEEKLDINGKLEDILIGIGDLIKRKRVALNLPLQTLGKLAKMDYAGLSRIEHGKINITLETLIRIYIALDKYEQEQINKQQKDE